MHQNYLEYEECCIGIQETFEGKTTHLVLEIRMLGLRSKLG